MREQFRPQNLSEVPKDKKEKLIHKAEVEINGIPTQKYNPNILKEYAKKNTTHEQELIDHINKNLNRMYEESNDDKKSFKMGLEMTNPEAWRKQKEQEESDEEDRAEAA